MDNNCKLEHFGLKNQIMFATGSLSFNMMERMIILYVAFYYLPPVELGEVNLIPEESFWGIITAIGLVMVIGRFFDAIADPLVAQLSDNNRSIIGRRKLFMLIGAVPLIASAVLIFFPPDMSGVAFLNSLWIGVMISFFYFSYTAYVNPFMALLPEIGHTEDIRINISTFMAFFGLIGMVLVMVIFPVVAGNFLEGGSGFRESYQNAALVFAPIALFTAFLAISSFSEKKHCLPSKPTGLNVWTALKNTYSIKHFRTYLYGELCVYFCVNIITMGMAYYAVVIFFGGEQLGIKSLMGEKFMTVIAGAALLVAIISFPAINILAKKIGKKKILSSNMLIMMTVTLLLFIFSGRMEGSFFYFGIFLFSLAGIPLAALTTLLFSTLADIAREDALRTGQKKEAMFYAARAIPLKMITALSGIVFGFFLSMGKDVANPLGIQLSLVTISIISLIGFFFFFRYPEEEVLISLRQLEKERLVSGELDIYKGNV